MNIGRLPWILALGSVAFGAQARKDCSELESEIELKFQAEGVQEDSLGVVPAADVGSGTVVGNGDTGTSRIVYTRGGSGATGRGSEASAAPKPAAPAARKQKTAAPPLIGNY